MLDRLFVRFRGRPDSEAVAAPGRVAASVQRPFASVTVVPGQGGCEAVRQLGKARILARKAPRLPLETCTRPDTCRCSYRKFSDRREDAAEDRRAGLTPAGGHGVGGRDRRLGAGRRGTDA